MNDEINYQNNPLHGVSLKTLLTEIVDHYGFELLNAYLNINCFKTNPSIDSSLKFLKKTDWAREKVESFYLYQYKRLPRATPEQFELSPRDRIIPEHQKPGEPAELSLEDAERLQQKRAEKAALRNPKVGRRPSASEGARNQPWKNKNPKRDGDPAREKRSAKENGPSYEKRPRQERAPKNETTPKKESANDQNKSGSNPWANWKK